MTTATVQPDITAFLSPAGRLGIRYQDRILCFDCSVKLDARDLDIALEKDEDPSQSCAHCGQAI